MDADNNRGSVDPLDLPLLGPGQEGMTGESDFGAPQPQGIEWGPGDLVGQTPGQSAAPARRAPERADWQGLVRAIIADLSPAVGLRYRAWAAMHRDLIAGMTNSQAFTLYVEVATMRDAMADELRPDDKKEYEWLELHMAGLRPLIEAEIQAKREEIADGVRDALLARVDVLRSQGLITEEVSQMMMAGVSNG